MIPRMYSDDRPLLRTVLLSLLFVATATGNDRRATENTDVDARVRVPFPDAGGSPLAAQDHRAQEYYREKAAALALRSDDAAASSRENAALLCYQALLAYREPDPCTARVMNAVARGGAPDTRLRAWLGRSLRTIELAQIAAQMPHCHWGPMRAGDQQLDLNVGIPLRRLSRLLDADARALAADGHIRAALARCLTLRGLARHTGDATYNLYSISQSIHTLALLALAHTLGTQSPDRATLTWLKDRLATVPGTPFEPTRALRQWRDAELQFWRSRPAGRPFRRELVLAKVPEADDRQLLGLLTDDQLLVLALQGEQRVPGLYGGLAAPPELLARARQACDQYLESALAIMNADLPYREAHARLREMVGSLDTRAADGDPIALLADAPKVVELYHRLQVRNAVYDHLLAAALEICLTQTHTGQLPRELRPGLPKDLYTGRDFEYERTAQGFLLRFDPNNLSRIRVRQFEFKTRDSRTRNP